MKICNLSEYIKMLNEKGLLVHDGATCSEYAQGGDFPVIGLSYDSRTVSDGTLFICKGAAFRREYLEKALSCGARAYISETDYHAGGKCILVTDVRAAMACVSKRFYNTDKPLPLIVGITGTKGKTTASFMLKRIFDVYNASQCRPKSAIISSLITYDGQELFSSSLTTPESPDLSRHIMNAAESGCPQLILEVSSQALKYGRTDGTDFDAVCFLNIGEDHISKAEHRDFEDYFSAKLSIFSKTDTAFIFSGCSYLDRISDKASACDCAAKFFGFMTDDDVFCSDISELGATGTQFTVNSKGENQSYSLSMSGKHNLENALAAIAVAEHFGVPAEVIREALSCVSVPGRDTKFISSDGKLTAIVDYAHNELSMTALLESTRSIYPGKRIVTVFGCPGGKAVNRREGMARPASRYSDYIILTEDDPGYEQACEICASISECLKRMGSLVPYETVLPRQQAIKRAFELASDGGVVLLCGKGAETVQKINGRDVPYNGDGYYVMEEIQKYDARTLHSSSGQNAEAEIIYV